MRLFKKIITSPEVEQAYNQFMLNFEIQALRITCYFGMFHVFFFLIVDYWRVDNYTYVFIYRTSAIFTVALIILLSHKKNSTVSYYNFLCVLLSTSMPVLFYLLDLTGSMPPFFAPNAMLLFFYVFNTCLGHSFKIKAIHTGILTLLFVLYSIYFSPHQKFHISQVWNISVNASVSLLVGYLVVWFKRLSFVRQEQVIESNSKLDLALQSAEMGVWSWNLKNNKRTADKKVLQLLGIEGKPFNGTSEEFFNIVHPDDREMLGKKLKEAIETRQAISPEYRVVWPDGSIHYIKARAKLICDVHGNPLELKGISWDITDQKLIEKELEDRQGQVNNFFNNAPDGIIIIDTNSTIHNWNPKAEEIFGWKAEEIIGKSLEQTIIPQAHRKAHFRGMQNYNNTGDGRIINSTIEITALRKNNEEFPILLSVSKTKVKGIPYFIGFINDITEKKKTENILFESDQKFRQISETINDVFYLYNIADKKYEFISQNCEDILGASQEFFYSGKKYNKTFVIEDDQLKMIKANEMVDDGTPYEVEYRIINNGEIKWIREKSFPIKNELGIAIKNSGICTDITHLKLQEIELLNQKRHLETLNNTKDKFFSIVAHDLKSPLNSLKAFTSLLIDHTDHFSKEEIIQTSKQAQLAVDNTIKMADNLITWARLQMNDYETKPETVYFTEAVASILPVYMRIAEKKGITLSWSFESTLTFFADKNHVQFIVRNLLNNAIKFTNREGSIKLSATILPNGQTQISVSDNGVGIPDEQKKKIFSVGKSQSSKGTAGEKGTGLGLMLCHEFTKLNGGVIEVESQVGQGTTFKVQLKSDLN